MIGVEDLFGLGNIHFHAGSLRPRQDRKPLDVVTRNRVVGGHRRHTREPAKLFQGLFLHVIRHAGVFNFLTQLFGVASTFVLFTQFLLDGLHLLTQVVLALGLLHTILHFRLDLVAELLNFQLFGEMLVNFL